MVRWVNELAAKSKHLSLIPRTHILGEESQLSLVPWSLHEHYPMHMPQKYKNTYMYIK